jgi:hypothetical protein
VPLFESEKHRRERLLKQALETPLRQLSAWLAEEGDAMSEEERQYYKVIYPAWLEGGSVTASIALNRCKSLRNAWGEGGEQKALAVTEVFALAMVSSWYRSVEEYEQHSEEERREARRAAASNVLTFFGGYSRMTLDDFLKFDAQLNADRDSNEDEHRKGIKTLWCLLLCTMAERACSGSRLDLSAVTFPVDLHKDLEEQGIYLVPFFDGMVAATAYAAGTAAMFYHYEVGMTRPDIYDRWCQKVFGIKWVI